MSPSSMSRVPSDHDGSYRSDLDVTVAPSSTANINLFSTSHPTPLEEPESNNQLSEAVLSLFGKNVLEIPLTGNPLQAKVAEICTGILQNGIGEQERQEIISKFPIPENCALLGPLN